MLLDFRATDKLRGQNGSLTTVIDTLLRTALEDASIDLTTLRIVCDWVQYKNNFREPADVRSIVGGTVRDAVEIAIDLRRALAKSGDLAATIARALDLVQERRGRTACTSTVVPDLKELHLGLQRALLERPRAVGRGHGPGLRACASGWRERRAQQRGGAREHPRALFNLGSPCRTTRAPRSAPRARARCR